MMDPMKYNSYLSGLYCGSTAAASITPPSSSSSDLTGVANTKDYSGMEGASTQQQQQSRASPYNSSIEGLSSSHHTGAKSSYSADSLSRSYFDSAMGLKGYGNADTAAQHRLSANGYDTTAAKSFTPDSMGSERAGSADSSDMKMMKAEAGTANPVSVAGQAGSIDHLSMAVAASAAGSFSSQQQAALAYYSQSMAASSGVMGQSGVQANGSLPPLLPMAAQLSQYAGAAAAGANYQQSSGSSGEYRRPMPVLL